MNIEKKQELIDFLRFLVGGSTGMHQTIYEIALASLTAKPEPAGFLLEYGGTDRELYLSQQEADKMRCEVVENGFLDVHLSPLFTHPAPAADLAELVPGEMTKSLASIANEYQTSPQNALFIVVGWNACRAAILRNIEEAK